MSHFMKNMFGPGKRQQNYLNDDTHHKEEQSDYQRLLQLCNSYGLNEEETKQLMDEFSKGSYRSGNTSFNHSLLNDSHLDEQDINDNDEQHINNDRSQNKQEIKNRERNSHKDKNNDQQRSKGKDINDQYDQYEQEDQISEQICNPQTTTRYYCEEHNQDSYNQMTFNNNHDSLINLNQTENLQEDHFHKGQIKDYQEITKGEKKDIFKGERKEKIERETDQPIHKKRSWNGENDEKGRNGEKGRRQKNSEKGSLSTQYNKGSLHSSQDSLGSIPQNEGSNQDMAVTQHNAINHQYVKRLIRSFQLLEKENDDLKRENDDLKKENDDLKKENDDLKEQILTMRENNLNKERQKEEEGTQRNRQISQLRQTIATYKQQLIRTTTMLQAQKEKSALVLSQNQTYHQTITQLNSTISHLTLLIKQKDAKTQELSAKICQLYQQLQSRTRENQSSTKSNQGSSKDIQGEKRKTQGSQNEIKGEIQREESKKLIAREDSRKILTKEDSNKLFTREDSNKILSREDMREITGQNEPRGVLNRDRRARELTQIMMDNINIPNNINAQNGGCGRSTTINKEKDERNGQMRAKEGVESKWGQSNSGNNGQDMQQERMKKRSGSRVDVKKYKGMIEELRNTYNNNPIR